MAACYSRSVVEVATPALQVVFPRPRFGEEILVRLTEPMSDDELFEFCAVNSELHIERTATGDLVIMPPTGGETGRRNSRLNYELAGWALRDGTGIAFDSNTGFILPNGAERPPDASWVRRERWEAVPPEAREKFAPICPDFVVELRSPSDRLPKLQAKMEEYLANGAKLGWLIDPKARAAWIYRPGAPGERVEAPARLRGDPVLPGFELDIAALD
jgi:Uma2 family endonuclease